jgi:transketolase
MLIYALLHLTGYDLSIEDIKQFRQLHSKTPGHPEYGYTPGIETTTGPLGQGITNAVGMALAEKILASEFNRPGFDIVNHYSYAFLGDGCLMEGISHEACSLAGTLGLGKLICFYDDNGISIDGHVEGWFSDDTPKRFEAYGWHVVSDVNGHNPAAIEAAIEEAKQASKKPSMICCKTVIGMGSPNKAGTHEVHGAALGEAEIAASRPHIGWDHPPFEIPKEIYDMWDSRTKGKKIEAEWTHKLDEYTKKYPREATEFKRRIAGDLPTKWYEHAEKIINQVNEKAETIASRKASQNAIEGLAPVLPELVGGSADLAGSNLTLWSGSKGISNETGGNYIYYGVREFGMSAIMNGLSLHGGIIPYGATFLMFSEYARNALRMAALMKIRNLFVFTHDSIGLGEDGPTHQPVEQTATLRYIPNMDVWRPCDSVESTVAWARSIERKDGPSTLIFSRQNLPFQKRNAAVIKLIDKGGYILSEAEDGKPQAIIIATGSEIGLAMSAQQALAESGIKVRVVSMPCTSLFDRQDQAYKDSVLLNGVKRVAVEAGTADFWYKYVGLEGAVVGMTTFGESAPAGDLFKHFGFTVDNVVKTVKNII